MGRTKLIFDLFYSLKVPAGLGPIPGHWDSVVGNPMSQHASPVAD